jgi:hypothetical protein
VDNLSYCTLGVVVKKIYLPSFAVFGAYATSDPSFPGLQVLIDKPTKYIYFWFPLLAS